MSLSFALTNAYTGLRSSARMAEVTANNIANANTEGYARREVNLQASVTDGRGSGVRISGISAAEARVLTTERRLADAELAEQGVLAETRTQIARYVGDPDEPGSLFSRYEALESTLRTLSDDPAATHLQLDVLNKANDLTEAFNEAQERIQAARFEVDQEIGRAVEKVNQLLIDIDEINKDAQRETMRGVDATESFARRDALIDELAEYIPLKVIPREDGRVRVLTDANYTLVGDSAVTLDFSNAVTTGPSMDLIGGTPGALSGLEVDGLDITPPATKPATVNGGKLSALFEARDVEYVKIQNQLDALATDLIDRFAEPTVEPTAGAGNPGIFTDAGAVASGVPGVAGRLAVNAAIDPDNGGALYRIRDGVGAVAEGDAGDNTHVVALLGAMTSERTAPAGSDVSGSPTAAGLIASLASMVATRSETADASLTMRTARHATLVSEEARLIGVDIDYELQNLTNIQNSYAANARVMEIINSLFDELLNI